MQVALRPPDSALTWPPALATRALLPPAPALAPSTRLHDVVPALSDAQPQPCCAPDRPLAELFLQTLFKAAVTMVNCTRHTPHRGRPPSRPPAHAHRTSRGARVRGAVDLVEDPAGLGPRRRRHLDGPLGAIAVRGRVVPEDDVVEEDRRERADDPLPEELVDALLEPSGEAGGLLRPLGAIVGVGGEGGPEEGRGEQEGGEAEGKGRSCRKHGGHRLGVHGRDEASGVPEADRRRGSRPARRRRGTRARGSAPRRRRTIAYPTPPFQRTETPRWRVLTPSPEPGRA